ncbi:MAG: hypothetical protein B6229_07015 [Spirochaetaceae bacterium 4572_7]|nr:MAG: hypothetical protein B6229_07015 [Spirochaetaceae bacterium 4572_7]
MERIKVIHSYNVQHDRDMEFHISKNAREKYNFKKQLFGITGNVIVPNLYEARVLADKINSADNSMVKASDIFAMGLIDEILHFIIAEHRSHLSSDIITNILKALTGSIGEKGLF